MKRIMLAAAAAVALSSAPALANCDSGEIVIKFSHVVSATGHPKGNMDTALEKRINEEMNGTA